jgi:hypothetical protein
VSSLSTKKLLEVVMYLKKTVSLTLANTSELF